MEAYQECEDCGVVNDAIDYLYDEYGCLLCEDCYFGRHTESYYRDYEDWLPEDDEELEDDNQRDRFRD